MAGPTGTPSLARESPAGRRMAEPELATTRSTAARSLSFLVRGTFTTPFARSRARSASMLSRRRCSADGAGGSCRSNSLCRHESCLRGGSGGLQWDLSSGRRKPARRGRPMGTVTPQSLPHSPSQSYRRMTESGDGESTGARAAGLGRAEDAPREAPTADPGASPASARSPSRRPLGCNHPGSRFHSPGAVRRALFLADGASPPRSAGREDAPTGASPPC